jgi:hypothetical protein
MESSKCQGLGLSSLAPEQSLLCEFAGQITYRELPGALFVFVCLRGIISSTERVFDIFVLENKQVMHS